MTYRPPLPPKVERLMPKDDFEAWLARQAAVGHDRMWLRRNATALHKRWSRNPTEDLPAPEAKPDKPYDRYSEI